MEKKDCQLSHRDRLSGTARPDIRNNINTMKRRASVNVRWHQRTKRVAAVVLVNMKTGAKFPSTLRKHHLYATTRSCHNHVLVSSLCNLHTLMQGYRIASHTAIDAPCSRRASASIPSCVGNTCFGLRFEQSTWMLYRFAVSSLNSPFLLPLHCILRRKERRQTLGFSYCICESEPGDFGPHSLDRNEELNHEARKN